MSSDPLAHGRRARRHGPWQVVTIGFGPSGLALAVALEEAGALRGALFLEQQPGFSWHAGMLLEGARVQVSCLKDLATLRNPRSRFTFLNYLETTGRLDEFVNLGTLRPTRLEFNDYLQWAARELDSNVIYGTRVSRVEPVVGARGDVAALKVIAVSLEHDHTEEHLARNVVLAAGSKPKVPARVKLAGSERIFHSDEFLQRIGTSFTERDREYRFLVVGDGQSGAEIFDFLASEYPHSTVTAATRGIGYRPMDETPFANRAFFPKAVDVFYELPETKRRELMTALRNLNYGVVDRELIDRIYRRVYDATVVGRRALEIRPFLELRTAEDSAAGVTVELHDWLHEQSVRFEVDGVIVATGYTASNPHPLLAGLAPYLKIDTAGRYQVDRNYQIRCHDGFRPKVFLQGYAQETHGISDTLLSLASVRAWDICTSVRNSSAHQDRLPAVPVGQQPATVTEV